MLPLRLLIAALILSAAPGALGAQTVEIYSEFSRPDPFGGIVTADKKFFVLLAPSPDMADYVGQTIRVTGKLRNGSILVDKLEVKKGTGWMEVKLSTMM